MTDEDVIRQAHEIANCGHVYAREGQRAEHKPTWRLDIGRAGDVAGWLMTLYPFMGERRKARIREALAAWKQYEMRSRSGHKQLTNKS